MKFYINLLIMLSIIYCSECDNVQNLYDNNSYVEAMELINANSDCLESEEFQYLKFLIAFKLEDFDLSRQMIYYLKIIKQIKNI